MAIADADILDRLYAAPFDADALSDALQMFGRKLEAVSLNMRLVDARSRRAIIFAPSGPFHTDTATVRSYFDHWVHHDLHMHAALARGANGLVFTGADLVDPEAAARDPYHNEFYWKAGCGPLLGWLSSAGDRVTLFGAMRALDQPGFEAHEARTLQRFQSHVDRALILTDQAGWRRLSAVEVAQLQVREGVAALRCAVDGRVLVAAQGAEAVLDDTSAVRFVRGRLIWRDPEAESRFVRACRAAANRELEGDFELVVRDDDAVLRISISPAPTPNAALVALRRIRRPSTIDPGLLQAVFKLSAAEARVAIAVAGGRSLPQIAADHGVKHATVRTQLRIVFAKLRVKRQSELAALLARIA